MKLRLLRFDLPLRHTFTISRGSIDVQPTLIVELEQEGVRGYGEATSNDYYGFTIENMAAALERVRARLESSAMTDPVALWDELHEPLADNPFAHCALDQAAYDLWGKLAGKPVYELLGLRDADKPLTNYTIGIDEIDVMVAKMKEFPDWPVYKIKLGTDRDVDIVRRLRETTAAVFRVDANCGWTVEQCLENAEAMKTLNVEFIEQPLPASDWTGMERLFEECPLPLVADESCQIPDDVPRCHGKFHGVNIKLVKCGGITPARRMIDQARALGLQTMVGCMTESTVGISAIAQLLPLLDYVDMDGALLLAKDIATGVEVDAGACRYAKVDGNGVTLSASGEELTPNG